MISSFWNSNFESTTSCDSEERMTENSYISRASDHNDSHFVLESSVCCI